MIRSGAMNDFSLAFRAALDLRDVIIAYEQLKEEFDRLEKRMDVVLAFAQDDRDKAKMRFAERMDEIEKRIDEVIESNMSPETREKFREQIEEFKKNSKRSLRDSSKRESNLAK